MKKNSLITLLLFGAMVMSLVACGNNAQDVEALSTESVKNETISENENLNKITSAESDWKIIQSGNSQTSINMTGFFDENYGISVGYAGKIVYTEDGGTTWEDGTNISYCRFGLEIVNKNVAYTCGNAGHVTKTTDGGKNWSRMEDFGEMEPNQCRILSFVDENLGMIAATKKLAITEDGGTTWTELTQPADIIGLEFTSQKACYILSKDNIIYISKDKGQTWDKIEMQLPEDIKYKTVLNSATFNMDENGNGNGELYCLNKDGAVMSLSTTDNCKTWTTNPMPETEGYTFIYLSKDGKTITLNTMNGDNMSVLVSK